MKSVLRRRMINSIHRYALVPTLKDDDEAKHYGARIVLLAIELSGLVRQSSLYPISPRVRVRSIIGKADTLCRTSLTDILASQLSKYFWSLRSGKRMFFTLEVMLA